MDEAKITYTMRQAVNATGYGKSRLYELLAAKKISARKDGRKTLIEGESLRAYLASLPTFTSTARIAA